MSPRHEQLPWFGMAAIALTIALWNSAASPLVVQRCLGARSEWDARLGAIVGAILLLALPVVFVLPGLAANLKLGTPGNTGLAGERSALQLIAVLFERTNPLAAAGQGLVVAAVLAAVTNSVSAAVHAVSTLWTMDISQGMLQRNDSESELVARGRMSSIVTIVLAALLTPLLLLWNGGVFDYVLELTAILAPPAAVVFLVSFFWSQVHARSAVATLVCGCIVGAALWLLVTQAQAEAVPQWLGPVCTRAGVTGLASLVLLGLFSLAIPASAQEYYDPGASWSLDLVRLPPHERDAGSGLGSLLLWWGMMFIASVALWVVLR
jgi:SSS family solute:Na+ symporter